MARHYIVLDTETTDKVGRKTDQPEPYNSLVYDLGYVVVDGKTGAELESNHIQLDLEPGTYQLLAWAGLNDTDYTWTKPEAGEPMADWQMAVKPRTPGPLPGFVGTDDSGRRGDRHRVPARQEYE